jgi:hypothetical protein
LSSLKFDIAVDLRLELEIPVRAPLCPHLLLPC